MKLLIFVLLLFATSIWAQPNYTAIAQLIKQGNTQVLATHWDTQVEITLNETDGFYDVAQASQLLGDFFAKNKPADCSIAHSGAARDGSSYYCIGNLTAGGKKYRLYILFKSKGDKFVVQEMRFEPA